MSHAVLAPSAAHWWMECPGSIALCEAVPEEPSSEYAAQGTFAHEIAAKALRESRDAVNYMGVNSPCGRFRVDSEMVDAVQLYLDTIDAVEFLHGRAPLEVEQRVTLTDEVWGTADALVWCEGVLHVFDFKYGAGVTHCGIGSRAIAKAVACGG